MLFRSRGCGDRQPGSGGLTPDLGVDEYQRCRGRRHHAHHHHGPHHEREDELARGPRRRGRGHHHVEAVGGHAEAVLRRAVRLGDGWMAAGATSTEESLQSLAQIRGYLAEAGRSEADFWLSKRLYIAIDEDEAAARQKLTEALTYQYGGKDQSGVGLAATPSRAVEVMGTLREAGAQHILLNPAYDHMRQMEVLMEKVIPQL